jgi:ribonuclease P protein component
MIALKHASGLFLLKKCRPVAKLYTLGKSERLKSRKQIEQLFKQGKKISIYPFTVHYQLMSLPAHGSRLTTQFGVGVGAKNFKKAVDRNRIKRLIRESYRLQKPNFSNTIRGNNQQLNVFIIYTGKDLPDYKFIYDKLAIALQKISLDIEKQSAK